ncbi:dihydroxyacetone kinase subunit DhaK [Paenibacillus sp. FSL W8-0186]|uniref:Dihydroxyacetone kinase subunit DhaK n=1 Tax=Paenibacillus woosongensis TaxID=307580 RepID=A0ABQ4MUQ9_9BACL|nr:dihydroxyacetone kinase subunit DhaK [Paenibacillus woosongensis]GIP59615.1 dihydroxyacetone kinase subunit DhaK [Paenibacillus woosongensis]
MQRFVNNPDFIVDDMLKGYVKAHGDTIQLSERNDRVVKTIQAPIEGKVGIVTGGGSGHEPAFLGYVGEGLVDAAAIGEVFASPPAQSFLDAIVEADSGQGVACLFGNYAGDNMNVKMAVQLAEDEGIPVKYVTATDDIASSPPETREKRHGIAGGLFMWKAGGARAAMGGSLDEVIAAAQKAVDHTRSICVGLSSCTIPAAGSPNFTIEEGMMEFGIGHHGEPGIRVEPLKTADEIAAEMTGAILQDFGFSKSEELAVMLSGLGATPLMELYVVYDKVAEILTGQGHRIDRTLIGNFVTSLDMNGLSLTIVRLDEELKELLDYPGQCPAFK